MYGYGGMGWGWMFVMVLLLVALCAGLVAVVVALTRSAHPVVAAPAVIAGGSSRGSRAHTILDERFARGEIDEAEHRARRAALDD